MQLQKKTGRKTQNNEYKLFLPSNTLFLKSLYVSEMFLCMWLCLFFSVMRYLDWNLDKSTFLLTFYATCSAPSHVKEPDVTPDVHQQSSAKRSLKFWISGDQKSFKLELNVNVDTCLLAAWTSKCLLSCVSQQLCMVIVVFTTCSAAPKCPKD